MQLQKELRRIDQVGRLAWALVEDNNLRGARRALRKIEQSFCVMESQRITTIVTAKIFERRGEREQAKRHILDNIEYVWAIPEAFEILASANPATDNETEHFHIKIAGGLATLGQFTQFSPFHIASFDVAANGQVEALSYIDELCSFAAPDEKTILECTKSALDMSLTKWRGVIFAYPFSVPETKREEWQSYASRQAQAWDEACLFPE